MLTLPIKKKWFDMILYGKKKEEYREITPYYITRFQNIGLLHLYMPTDEPKVIALRNGYRKDSPTMTVLVRLEIKEGKPEWGAEQNKTYYVLKIKEVLSFDDPNEPKTLYTDCDRVKHEQISNCGDCGLYEICREAWKSETH